MDQTLNDKIMKAAAEFAAKHGLSKDLVLKAMCIAAELSLEKAREVIREVSAQRS